jgi:hypothetical protein
MQAPHIHRQGPDLGGVNLGICHDFSQIRCFPRLPSAPSVGRAKALRSTLGLAIAQGTTKSFSESDDVVDLQLKKTTTFLELQVDVRRGVERRPCCSCLMLNRCALRDCCIACAGFGYASAAIPRLSHMPPPPHVARWSCIMDARRALSKPRVELFSLAQQRAQRPGPDVRRGEYVSDDQWQVLLTAGYALIECRRVAAIALLMLASQHECASSDVERF